MYHLSLLSMASAMPYLQSVGYDCPMRPPWLSGLAISGRGAVKAWLAIRQGLGSYPTPAGMSSQVSA